MCIRDRVYTAFSGSHQDAIRKCLHKQATDEPWQVAYLPIDPRDLGRDYQAVIRVNSQSGKGGVAFVMERDFGLTLPRWMQVELAQIVQHESEAANGEISSERIHELFIEHFADAYRPFTLLGYRLDRRDGIDVIEAEIARAGNIEMIQGTGEGAIEAFVNAWAISYGNRINVVDYSEHTLGTDTSAEAVAYVQLNIDGQRSAGVAFDRDTVSASMRAMLASLNRAQQARAAA